MTTQTIGVVSVSTLSIGVNLALPSLTARLGELNDLYAELSARLANLQANLTALATLTLPSVPQLVAALNAAITGAAQIITQMPTASVSLVTSLNADIAAIVALQAAIQVKIDALVALIADLNAALGGSGILAVAYDGTAADCGDELDGVLGAGIPGGGGGGASINALLLACESPSNWAKLGVVLKVES